MASASTVVARLVQLNDGGADDRAFDIRDKELTIGRCAPSRGRRRRRVVARGVVSGVPGTRAKRSRRAVSSPRAGEQTRDPRRRVPDIPDIPDVPDADAPSPRPRLRLPPRAGKTDATST
jgi:hypothetical protein